MRVAQAKVKSKSGELVQLEVLARCYIGGRLYEVGEVVEMLRQESYPSHLREVGSPSV